MTEPEHHLRPYREADELGFVPCWCDECQASFLNADVHEAEVAGV
jgi:hypothetical protein